MSSRRASILVLASAVATGAVRMSGAQSPDPIPNGSFEEAAASAPAGWRPFTWAGRAMFEHVRTGRSGGRSILVSSAEGADAAWFAVVPVRTNSTYRLSAWIKTEDVRPGTGQGALVNVHARPERTAAVTGTRDWTRVESEIRTGPDDALQINCLLGYFGRATGRAWFDDVSLELISTAQAGPSAAVIDGRAAGEPISPYIYSQFIEHLGRCIYGGIWAEMLEDRKFYYPVGSRDSPWRITGTPNQVKMESAGAFTGDHSPRVLPSPGGGPGGLSQGRLAIRPGKSYTGHVWLSGDAGAAPVRLSLSWGDRPDQRQVVTVPRLSSAFARTPLTFTPAGGSDNARLEITGSGKGSFRIGAISLMPADHKNGLRPDTLALLKELNAPLYRWPGGNFVSGYDWRDGIGDRDRRPSRRNPAWQGIDSNDFGIHEFLAFCRELRTEPLVVVNTGFGDAHSAAQEVEYVNGSSRTPMGRLRGEHGRREPFGVRWWGIGNEMYGDWQLGHMSLNQYVVKHNDVHRQMLRADPTIKTVAVGDAGAWSEGMLRQCAGRMDLISEHFYCQERPGIQSHVAQVPAAIRAKVAAHRRYRETIPGLAARNIRIAIDEWNYWYGPHVFGELGTRYFLKDALGIAAGLHEFYRSSDLVFMANYAQTVNVIGAIKTTPTAAAMETTGLVLKLYRKEYGTLPLRVTGSPDPLDVAAALTADRKTLTIGVVNPGREARDLGLTLQGIAQTGSGRVFRISHEDPQAYNDPGSPARVVIQEERVERLGPSIRVPGLSVSLFRVELR